MTELEQTLRPLLTPVLGGYLRPWMTSSSDPEKCKVWVVGANPAKPFPIENIDPFDVYLDALFNRHGRSLRAVYDDLTAGRPSPTRRNLVSVRVALESVGIRDVLETNLNSYPTRMSSDLCVPANREGRDRGEAIFEQLLESVKLQVVWLHGAGTLKKFRSRFESRLPRKLADGQRLMCREITGRFFVLTPSLSPPAFNRWVRHFDELRKDACQAIASHLG